MINLVDSSNHFSNNLGLMYLIHFKMCSQLNITNSLQHFRKVQILLEWLRECHVIFAKCLVNRCSKSSSQRETQAHFFKKVSFKYQHLVIMVNQGNNSLVHSLSSKTVMGYLDVRAICPVKDSMYKGLTFSSINATDALWCTGSLLLNRYVCGYSQLLVLV